jgi:hypothetical protein
VKLDVFRYEEILAPNNLFAYCEPSAWNMSELGPAALETLTPSGSHFAILHRAAGEMEPTDARTGPLLAPSGPPADQTSTARTSLPTAANPATQPPPSFVFATTMGALDAADGFDFLAHAGLGGSPGILGAGDTPDHGGGSGGNASVDQMLV